MSLLPLPEIVLIIYAIVAVFLKTRYNKKIDCVWGLAAAFFICLIRREEPDDFGFFCCGPGGYAFKSLLSAAGIVISRLPTERDFTRQISLCFLEAGSLTAISAGSFLFLFLALEITAAPQYLFDNRSLRDDEGKIRLALLLRAASLLLFSAATALIYYSCGSINFNDVRSAVAAARISSFAGPAWALLLMAAAFRMRIRPPKAARTDGFEIYGPAVFVTAYPAAAFVAYKLIADVFRFPEGSPTERIITAVGLASVLYGSFGAAFGNDIMKILRRCVVCSFGTILICAALRSPAGLYGTVFSLISDMIAAIGIHFAAAEIKTSKFKPITNIEDLKALSCQFPVLAVAISVLFLSLTGFPPFPGFRSRFYVCLSLFEKSPSAFFYPISFVFNLICATKILSVLWFGKNKNAFAPDRNYGGIICLILLTTIFAIPSADKISNTLQTEFYFAR
ncbi:MAG: hypothetical protein LBO73_00875 [Holosporaceae bacterium]|nr:hypothetical protein [Holosporaceae bacterium]